MKKIRVGAVSYLNTKPLLHGIKNHEIIHNILLVEDYPARIADMLLRNEIDVGLVPVAVIPRLKESHIITDFCIGSDGEVASVCIFSEVVMEDIDTVILDNQSRTSVALARILLKEYWKRPVTFVQASSKDYREEIRGNTAAVIIGDRALEQRTRSKFIYDLGLAWKDHTGLPFVYAAWIANKEIDPVFVRKFNAANAFGLQHLEEVILENDSKAMNLKKYYTSNIQYALPKDLGGLQLFLEKMEVNNA